jgi:hypothetical protein
MPKPLLGLLLGTIVFFAIWMVALKPKTSAGGSQGGVGQYQSAIDKAHQAVTTSNQANAKLGAPTATVQAPKPATPAKAASPTPGKAAAPTPAKTAAPTPAKTGSKGAAKSTSDITQSATAGVQKIQSAIRAGKVVAVLFYNDAAADDRAVKNELAAVPTHGGKVVKLAVPVSQLTQYSIVTQQIPVVTAPTLVLIDAAHQATMITGYADPVEIMQRISDALSAK